MLRCSKTYDTDLTAEKTLSLQVKAGEVFMEIKKSKVLRGRGHHTKYFEKFLLVAIR